MTDDVALLGNTQTQADYLVRSLEQTIKSTGLNMNSKQSKCVFKKGAIFCGNISLTERDINLRWVKEWNSIGKLSIIWKSDLSDKIKP